MPAPTDAQRPPETPRPHQHRPSPRPETAGPERARQNAKPSSEPHARRGTPLACPPIPITLSGDYDFVVRAETPQQVEGLFFLLQADGRPFSSVLCKRGHQCGLELIDGQEVERNETLLRESLVGQGQTFRLTCQMRRNQIRVLLDDRVIIAWDGEFGRLNATSGFGSCAADGILGLVAHGPYRIHELRLDPHSDVAKQSVTSIGDRAVVAELHEMGVYITVRQSGLEREYGPTAPMPSAFLRATQIHFAAPLSDADMPRFAALLRSLPQLGRCGLVDTDITDDGLRQVPPLRRLEDFGLSGALVQDPIAALQTDATQLKRLWLANTRLSDEGLEGVRRCSSLRELYLERAQLTDERLLRVGVLPQLEKFVLSDNPLELNDEAIRHLARFKGLVDFTADRISANEEGLMRLTELKQVIKLSLAGTKTTDRVLVALEQMPNLRELYLQDTPATEAGVKAFQAAKPDCRVEWSPAK